MIRVSPTHAFHPTGTRTCFPDSVTFEIHAWNNRPLEDAIRAENIPGEFSSTSKVMSTPMIKDIKGLKYYCINCGKFIEKDEPYIETEHGYFKHRKACRNES